MLTEREIRVSSSARCFSFTVLSQALHKVVTRLHFLTAVKKNQVTSFSVLSDKPVYISGIGRKK